MDYISGWCKSQRRLDGFTAIVTGANGGIGKYTTLDFYKRGARVIMACRNIDKAAAVKRDILESASDDPKSGTLAIEKLDLCSLTSVRDFARRVLASEERIQILVNNGGVMCSPEGRTEDDFEIHIGSNHLGHALLTLLLLPRMIESAPSRIVFVSSAINYCHKINFEDINYRKTRYKPLEAYSKSKIANILFAKALAQKLKEHNIKGVTTYSLHPGIVHSDIDRHFSSWISYWYRSWFLKWAFKSARCGAQTSIYCAVAEGCAEQSGLYYTDCIRVPPSFQCQKTENAIKLWDLTIKMLVLEDYNPFSITDEKVIN